MLPPKRQASHADSPAEHFPGRPRHPKKGGQQVLFQDRPGIIAREVNAPALYRSVLQEDPGL